MAVWEGMNRAGCSTLVRNEIAERMQREFNRITLPVFIMHVTNDKATIPAGSRELFDKSGATDKTLRMYEGHYHDLLNDVGKEGCSPTSWDGSRSGLHEHLEALRNGNQGSRSTWVPELRSLVRDDSPPFVIPAKAGTHVQGRHRSRICALRAR